MAEHTLETRILLRYGTYSQWMNSETILKLGEAAVCAFPQNRTIEGMSNNKPDYTPPAIGIKIGNGHDYFKDLPWVQGIAADVYNWAKSSVKPTYSAQEIQGLQSYVENLIGGDVDVNIAPRIYQLVQGTGDNINKYYLRYKENDENSNWIIDTSTSIDLQGLEDALDWLGRGNIEDYPNLISRTAEQIRYFIGLINAADTAREHYFVTEVAQSNGTISVERARPTFADISGITDVTQGGTGRNTLTEDYVLVGNGTDPVKLIPIAESIENNNHLVPNNLIKAYVDTAVSGITGAMHFIGDSSVVINNNSSVDPQISGYIFANAQLGDVILYDSKEFVWTGINWRLLGDEGSYAIKGSIKDADIDENADIQQSKIAGLDASFNTKVDKVEGKSLTSNDFTDELYNKLEGIEDSAQRNIIEHIYLNTVEVSPITVNGNARSIDLQIEEFDSAARSKLSGIASGAEVNKIEKITYDGTEITPDANRVVAIVSDPHTEHENKIEQIFINGREWAPNNDKQVKITIDQAALNLSVIEGAVIPRKGENGVDEVSQSNKKLELSRIAVSGNVEDLLQTSDTYVIFDCGTSTTVI